ncbi:MAG: hypothetical protein IT340_11505 [Chloroflexi bacterium]|nr:hypothetical protein [Chloroflexota bacterium]
MADTALVLALTSDLWFLSRIRSAVGTRATVATVRRAADLPDRAAAAPPALVLIDLNAPGQEWADAVRRLRAAPATAAVPVIAFGPHVDVGAQALARAAGADRVLSNQRFTDGLPVLLAPYLPDRPDQPPA